MVDPTHTQPVDRVRHELLEAGVLDSCHTFGTFEISGGCIPAFLPLASIINQELCHLTERTAFLAIVNDDAESARLGSTCTFLNTVDQIRATGADIRAENIGSIAFIVYAAGYLRARIREPCDVAE